MELSNFLGGLYVPQFFGATIPSNALLRADNIEYDPAGGIRGRRGRALYATLPAAATSLWRHYPKTGSPSFLAALDSGTSVTLMHDTASTGTFAPISGGGTYATGKRFFWTNWASKDRSFGANGDVLISYNGVISSVVQSGVQITGPYLVTHQSRLFGTRSDELTYSVYSSDINDETHVDPVNQINVSDPAGSSITGLVTLPDRLLILKGASIWTLLGDIKFSAILTKLTDATGCIAPHAVAQAPYGVFFVGRQGIYLTDGVNPNPLEVSGALRPLFTSPTGNITYPNAVGYYYPRKDQYHVKLDPSHAHTYVLSRVPKVGSSGQTWAWAVNMSEPLVAAATWDSESDTGNAYVSDHLGHIYQMDTGATDDGAAYTSMIQTAALRLDEQQRVGRVSYLFLNYQGTGPATVGLRYNNASVNDLSFTLGETGSLALQRPRQMVVDQSKSGQFVSAVVVLPADGPSAELYSIRMDARLRSSRVWR